MIITIAYLVVFGSWLSDCNGSKTPQLNGVILDKLLVALEKAYDFYESDYKDVNLDGIYGLRVSQGALVKILEEQKSGKLNINKSILSRISKLERKAANIAEESLPKLKQSNPAYYKKFETTVAVPWKNFKPFKKLDYSLYVPANKRSEISFDEDTSDHCMTEMTGTGELPQKPCQLSSRCWNLMMTKGADGYALTHQALFLLIGEVQGCKNALQQKLKSFSSASNLQGVYDRICASMYPQMVEFEKTNKDSFQYERDLYMEQAMVCGSMGYYEFMSAKRLQKILGWQKKSGCFGDIEDNQESEFKRAKISHVGDKRKMPKELGLEENLYDQVEGYDSKVGANSRKLTSMRTMRTLLVEKALGGGCMSHVTGVATGLLGVYLRWAVHMMYPGRKHTSEPTTIHMSHDSAEQEHPNHLLMMRKMMQKQPPLVNRMQPEVQKSFKIVYLLMAVVLALFLGYSVFTKKCLARGLGAIMQFRKHLIYHLSMGQGLSSKMKHIRIE